MPVAAAFALLPWGLSWWTVNANPLDLPAAADRVLLPGAGSDTGVRVALGGDRPVVAVGAALSVSPLGGAGAAPALVLCADRACASPHIIRIAGAADPPPALAALADGSVAVAVWQRPPGSGAAWQLRLLTCRAGGCDDPGRAPALLTASADDLTVSVAIAAAPGGGLVVADASGPASSGELPVRLVFCPDVRCGRPLVVTLPSPIRPAAIRGAAPLALAVGPDARPVVGYHSWATGGLTLMTCGDPACATSAVTMPVADGAGPPLGSDWSTFRLALALGQDARPVLAFTDVPTRTQRLLVCATDGCEGATSRVVSRQQWIASGPALALDRSGRPLMAFQDAASQRLALVACADPGCGRVATRLAVPSSGIGSADIAIGADGAPRVAWSDGDAIHLLTCADPGCGRRG